MGANLKGLANTLKNKIYEAKIKKVDVSFIPKGYSKLADTQLLNLINRLGQATNGVNYSYKGVHNPTSPKVKTSKAKSIRVPKELKQHVKEGQLTPAEANELGKLLTKELNYNKTLSKKYPNPKAVSESLGREFFSFQHGLESINKASTREGIYSLGRLRKGAKMTLEDLRKGKHLFDIEKELNKFDLSKDNFAILNKGRLQGSGLSKKVNGIYRNLSPDKKFKFLAKFHEIFWEEYEDDLADGDLSYEEMYESLTTLINDIKRGV